MSSVSHSHVSDLLLTGFCVHYSFDQARLIRQNRVLARNGIDPSGMELLIFGIGNTNVGCFAFIICYRNAIGL